MRASNPRRSGSTNKVFGEALRPLTAPPKKTSTLRPKTARHDKRSAPPSPPTSRKPRPKTVQGFAGVKQRSLSPPLSSRSTKGSHSPRRSPRRKGSPIRTKTTVEAWVQSQNTQDTQEEKKPVRSEEEEPSQQWSWPSHPGKTAFRGTSLIPGSVPTMVAFSEGDEEEEQDEEPFIPMMIDRSLLNEPDSSEYETDLEEDFPEPPPEEYDPSGRNVYLKLCKKAGLVPVSFLSSILHKKEVVMKHHGLGIEGALPIAKALVKNTIVEKLDLTDNYLCGPGGAAMAKMLLENCYISELNLSENFLRSEGGSAVAQVLLTNHSLRKLILSSNHLTDKDAKVIAEALKENRTLKYLDISHNDIGETGGLFLGAGLGMNYGLQFLDVSWNSIRLKGGVAMASALKSNDSLKTLNISWNGLAVIGCMALGRFLKKNDTLEELDVSNNRIGHLGATKICPGISANTSLKIFKIGLNPIGDEGVEKILKAVKCNTSIKLLGLQEITISPKLNDEIQEMESVREIRVIHGGLGGYRRPKELPPGMQILLDFIQENRLRLVDWFFQFDKDHSGDISREEFKVGLKETGLDLTSKQLDTLMEFIDIDNSGTIEYSELLIGRQVTLQEQRVRRKVEERERQLNEERLTLPELVDLVADE